MLDTRVQTAAILWAITGHAVALRLVLTELVAVVKMSMCHSLKIFPALCHHKLQQYNGIGQEDLATIQMEALLLLKWDQVQ
mmetsp:Transcript_83896/g.224451  ORF Transcript_83896/g.224451 Transcript_83896/m.224451 type:complete len:81 (+) Transcript_83896:336-578(+)